MNSSLAIEYYNKKYGNNIEAAFIHLIREIGEVAFAIEKSKSGIATTKLTEAIALLYFISSKYDFDVEENLTFLYTRKMESLIKNTPKNNQKEI